MTNEKRTISHQQHALQKKKTFYTITWQKSQICVDVLEKNPQLAENDLYAKNASSKIWIVRILIQLRALQVVEL